MSIINQFNYFYHAKLIIAQHGAGLSNIFFTQYDCNLLEITPKWNINNYWFKNLSEFCEIKYYNIDQKEMTLKQVKDFFNKRLNSKINNTILDYFKNKKKYDNS